MEDFDSLDLADGMFSADAPSTLTATVGRLLPDGTVVPVKVEYAVIDGKAVYEGDIVIGPKAEQAHNAALSLGSKHCGDDLRRAGAFQDHIGVNLGHG